MNQIFQIEFFLFESAKATVSRHAIIKGNYFILIYIKNSRNTPIKQIVKNS